MNFNVTALVYTGALTKDGYGGRLTNLKQIGRITCMSTPLDETSQNKKYGVHTKDIFQIITADTINNNNLPYFLLINGFYYRPYYDRDYGKRRVIFVERVSINGSAV